MKFGMNVGFIKGLVREGKSMREMVYWEDEGYVTKR